MYNYYPFMHSPCPSLTLPQKEDKEATNVAKVKSSFSVLDEPHSHQKINLYKDQSQMLAILMLSMNSNTIHLQNLDQKLMENQVHMNSLASWLQEDAVGRLSTSFSQPKRQHIKQQYDAERQMNECDRFKATDPMINKLFGNQSYKYRLQLQGNPINTLFKERNFNLSIRLVDQKRQKIKNSNMLHLCLAVCSNRGEWVTNNQAGEPILKGKTEIDLYHGETSFHKIYFRQISKKYAHGTLNLVVYVKPSLLQIGVGNPFLEKEVDCADIQPLVLPNIIVLSKRYS